MNIADVMTELGTAVGQITGLRVFDWPPGSVSPPAVIVGYPTDYQFDATYGRGTDTMTLPVIVVVGRATDRSTRDTIAAYVAGIGDRSIKTWLEASTHIAFDEIRVTQVEFDAYSIGGVDYLAAVFDVDLAGPGTT